MNAPLAFPTPPMLRLDDDTTVYVRHNRDGSWLLYDRSGRAEYVAPDMVARIQGRFVEPHAALWAWVGVGLCVASALVVGALILCVMHGAGWL